MIIGARVKRFYDKHERRFSDLNEYIRVLHSEIREALDTRCKKVRFASRSQCLGCKTLEEKLACTIHVNYKHSESIHDSEGKVVVSRQRVRNDNEACRCE